MSDFISAIHDAIMLSERFETTYVFKLGADSDVYEAGLCSQPRFSVDDWNTANPDCMIVVAINSKQLLDNSSDSAYLP